MDDVFEFLMFTAKVAFVESGRALWWITVGELISLLVGILVLLVGWRLTKFLFSESKVSVWARRLLMVTWIVLMVPALGSAGFFWGVNVATEKTIESQQLIEHAFEEALYLPIESGIGRMKNLTEPVSADLANGREPVDKGSSGVVDDASAGDEKDAMSEEPKLYSAADLLKDIDSLESGPLKRLMDEVGEKLNFDSSVIPDWVLKWISHQALGIVQGEDGPSLAEVVDKFREVIVDAEANDEEGDGMVSARQLAWSTGSTQGLPVLQRYMGQARTLLIVATAVQLLLIVGVSTLLFWLVTWSIDKTVSNLKEPDEPATDQPS
ncbi:MAG: hypothetical protein AAFX06_00510 [Planctomycetota bacterium]